MVEVSEKILREVATKLAERAAFLMDNPKDGATNIVAARNKTNGRIKRQSQVGNVVFVERVRAGG